MKSSALSGRKRCCGQQAKYEAQGVLPAIRKLSRNAGTNRDVGSEGLSSESIVDNPDINALLGAMGNYGARDARDLGAPIVAEAHNGSRPAARRSGSKEEIVAIRTRRKAVVTKAAGSVDPPVLPPGPVGTR